MKIKKYMTSYVIRKLYEKNSKNVIVFCLRYLLYKMIVDFNVLCTDKRYLT